MIRTACKLGRSCDVKYRHEVDFSLDSFSVELLDLLVDQLGGVRLELVDLRAEGLSLLVGEILHTLEQRCDTALFAEIADPELVELCKVADAAQLLLDFFSENINSVIHNFLLYKFCNYAEKSPVQFPAQGRKISVVPP